MSGTRLARIGFAVYAITVGLGIGLGFWQQHLFQRFEELGHSDVRLQMKLVSAGFIALEIFGVLALLAAARLPASLRARKLLWTAAGLAAFGLVASQLEQLIIGHAGFEHTRTVLSIVGGVLSLSYAASEILALVVGVRVARATGADWLRGLTIAAMVSRATTSLVWMLPIAGAWTFWLHRGTNVLVAAACAGIAAMLSRLPEAPAPAQTPRSDGRLSPAWSEPAAGITLYLGAAVARILLALVSYAVMAGARGATSLYELRDLRGQMLTMAVLSGMASVAMLAGLWRISRAPAETSASGPALLALALGCAGLGLDAWSTSITADALGGDISAAFFAMDALPWITGISLLLGIGLGMSLLRALGNLATALERTTLVEQTRGATWLLVGAGAAGLFGLAMSKLATELLLVFAILAVPLALAAAVQLIRAALGVAREIRTRV